MQDIQFVYGNARRKFMQLLPCLPVLIVACLIYEVIQLGLNRIFLTNLISGRAELNFILGFVRWMVGIAIMSHLAGLLDRASRFGKLSFSDIVEWNDRYRGPLSQVFFLLFLVEMLWSRAGLSQLFNGTASFLIGVAWMILTAPAYEAVYIGGENGNTFISGLVGLWRVNGKVLLPVALLGGAVYAGMQWLGMTMVLHDFFEWRAFVIPGLRVLLGSGFMLYRSVLFREVYFSNPRSREFKRRTL